MLFRSNSEKHSVLTKVDLETMGAPSLGVCLRVVLELKIKNVSTDDFGQYICLIQCNFAGANNSQGCLQQQTFSVIPDDWEIQLYQFRNIVVVSFVEILCVVLIVLIIVFGRLIVVLIQRRNEHKTQEKMITLTEIITNVQKSEQMEYDIFLSYSSRDRDWVEGTLLKILEDHGYKVCFDERDFKLGSILVEEITKAVYTSYKVLAVVSPDYLRSRWCVEMEFLLTYTKILNKHGPTNSLLVIKYKPCHMPTVMTRKIYLDYTALENQPSMLKACWNRIMVSFGRERPVLGRPCVIEKKFHRRFWERLLRELGPSKISATKIKSSNVRMRTGRRTQ